MKTIKAAALFYSIVISLIIAGITGSAIMLSGLSAQIFQRQIDAQELSLNAISGLQLLLDENDIIPEESGKAIDLYGTGNDSVFLSRHFWGAFELIASRAERNGRSESRMAAIGYIPDSSAYCLYLADRGQPLAICGKTEIRGLAYLPKAGIKRAYIEGQNYSGSSLVYGGIRQSREELPEFNKSLIQRIANLKNESSSEMPDAIRSNSFINETRFIAASGKIILSDSLSGKIVIVSATAIEITAQALLKDVIVYAPKVMIREGFSGNLQIFAEDSVIAEENVKLFYPSVIGIVQKSADKASCILLAEKDTIEGCVFAGFSALKNKFLTIKVPKDAVVYGSVYSAGYAEISGAVYGSVMCENIYLQTSSSVYNNHILNAVLDRSKLPENFIGVNLVAESERKGIIKWLQ